jgi:sigma-B regulation protein RsbU (phosphoserine phosphatase)
LLIDVNARLAEHLDNRSFISMTYAVFDMERRIMTSARAGHPPFIAASGSGTELVASGGMVVGVRLPGASVRFAELLQEHTQPLRPGDVVVLYTDGVTEAMDRAGDLFGDGALARTVTDARAENATVIRDRVLREVGTFVGDADPHDDITMVVLKASEEAT